MSRTDFLISWLSKLSHSPKRQLALLLVALSLGVLVGQFLGIGPYIVLIGILVAALAIAGYAISRPHIAWKTLAGAVFLVGCLSGSLIGNERETLKHLVGTDITAQGRVVSFARPSGALFRFTVRAEESYGNWFSFPLVVTSGDRIERGSLVTVNCVLRESNHRFECRGGSVKVEREPRSIIHLLNRIRDRAYISMIKFLPEGNAALLAGMIYGGDEALPRETRDAFREAGLLHLVAVSGANLAVITVILYGFLTAIWFSRKQAALLATLALGLFVTFVGFDSSVVRAAIMGGLLLAARYLGRPRAGGNALLFAASLMLFVNPWLLHDLGFLLSVSATAGIMFLTNPLEDSLKFIPEFGSMRSTVAVALAAWLSTIPVLAMMLGNVSLVSPLTNIIAAPFAAIIFLLGLAWVATIMFEPITLVLSFLLTFLLEGLRFTAHVFSLVRYASIEGALPACIATIAAIACMIWLLRKDKLSFSPL